MEERITFPTFSFKEKSEASLRSKLPFKTRCSLRISRFFEKDDRSSMLTIAGFGAEGIGGGEDLEKTSKLLCNFMYYLHSFFQSSRLPNVIFTLCLIHYD